MLELIRFADGFVIICEKKVYKWLQDFWIEQLEVWSFYVFETERMKKEQVLMRRVRF